MEYYSLFSEASFYGNYIESNEINTGSMNTDTLRLSANTNQIILGPNQSTIINVNCDSNRTINFPTTTSDADVVLTDSDQTINGQKTFSETIHTHDISPELNLTYSIGNYLNYFVSVYSKAIYISEIRTSDDNNITVYNNLILDKLTAGQLLKLDGDKKIINDPNVYVILSDLLTMLDDYVLKNSPVINYGSANQLLRTNGSGLVYTSNTLPDGCSVNNFTITNPHINFVTTNSVLMTNGSGYAYVSNTLPDISTGTILPVFTSNNLGSIANRWNYIYVKSGDFYSIDSGNILPSLGLTYDLGSSGKVWNNIYVDTVNANVINVNAINLTGSIVPTATNTYDLGSSSNRWRTIYFYDIRMLGTIGSNFIPNGSRNLGDTTSRWNNFYANNSDINTLTAGNSYLTNLFIGDYVKSNLTPYGTFSLGTSGRKWENVYANNLYGSWTPSGNLIPSTNNAYDIGSSSYRWKGLYTKAISDNGSGALVIQNSLEVSNSSTGNGNWGNITVKGNYTGDMPLISLYNQTSIISSIGYSNQDLCITSFNGNTKVKSHLNPYSNNSHSLGTTSTKWASIYSTALISYGVTTELLTVDRSTYTGITGSLDINVGTSGGASTSNHAKVNLAIKGGGGGNVYAGMDLGYYDGALPLVITSSGGDIVFKNTISPYTDNVYSCGKNGKRWSYIWTGYGVLQTSDGNDKENIQECELGLDFINDLKPKKYNWKGEKGNHYGIVAQDLEETLNKHACCDFKGLHKPEDEKDKYGINYSQFIPILIKSIQELSAEVNQLKEKIIELEN